MANTSTSTNWFNNGTRDGVDTRKKGKTTSLVGLGQGGQSAAVVEGNGRGATHWLLRVGDGIHFTRSQSLSRWGVCSKHSWTPSFLRNVRNGDLIWFIQSNSGGKVMGVATYSHHCVRVLGPLIDLTPTNNELGWTETDGDWDTEVHYRNLYDMSAIAKPILTHIKSPLVGRSYNPEKCNVDLPKEYGYITRYLHPK